MNFELKLLLCCVLLSTFCCVFLCVLWIRNLLSLLKSSLVRSDIWKVFSVFKWKLMLKISLNYWSVFELLNSRKLNSASGGLTSKSRILRLNGVEWEFECAEFEDRCFEISIFEARILEASCLRTKFWKSDFWGLMRRDPEFWDGLLGILILSTDVLVAKVRSKDTFILHSRSLIFQWSSNYKPQKFRKPKNRVPKSQFQTLCEDTTSEHQATIRATKKHLNTNNQSWRSAPRG